MMKILAKYTLLWSFAFGAFLAVILFQTNKKNEINKNKINIEETFEQKYDKWFEKNGGDRLPVSLDKIKFGAPSDILLESDFLFKKVNLNCVILVKKRKNALAASETWAKHCNGHKFVYLQNEKIQKTMLPIRQNKIESSWHLLCDAIRTISLKFEWALFLFDDTFAIPENIRKMVAGLDANKGYYLGHAISFWGTNYNVGQAGYVLSRGSIIALQNLFNSSEACINGGRFWRQEDFYLGKHLSRLGINPVDTRDENGLSTFHGFNLGQLLFPGSLPTFSNYYKYALFPVVCCSPNSVTFQTIEADKMYNNYYMIYGVQVFSEPGLGLGNHPPSFKDESIVWRTFLEEQGIHDNNISANAYYDLWKSIVNDPVRFNQDIRDAQLPHN